MRARVAFQRTLCRYIVVCLANRCFAQFSSLPARDNSNLAVIIAHCQTSSLIVHLKVNRLSIECIVYRERTSFGDSSFTAPCLIVCHAYAVHGKCDENSFPDSDQQQ